MYGCWAHLPRDILIDIANRFDSVEDMAAFSSVCSSWNAISKTVKLKWTPALPWLMLPQNTKDQLSYRWTLFNPSTKKLYNMVFPETFGGRSWGSADGWICTLNRKLEFHLFNPLTKVQLNLPSAHTLPSPMLWGSGMDYNNPDDWFKPNCIISTLTVLETPLNNELLVFLIYNKVYLCVAKPGDYVWAALQSDESLDNYEGEDRLSVNFVESVVGFNGQIMVLYENGKLASLGKSDGFLTDQVDSIARGCFLGRDEVGSIAEVCVPGDFKGDVVSGYAYGYGSNTLVNFTMVESFGDLLVVLQYLRSPLDSSDLQELMADWFEVFKFDSEEKKWVILDDLGDVSLFVGDRSGMAVRASMDNCKPNCIYFIEAEYRPRESSREYSLGIYNLEDGKMEEVYVGDDSLYKFQFPFWFMPKPV